MSTQPKVNRAALSQVERLVGRLPLWMKTTAASMVPGGTSAQSNHLRPNGFGAQPMRTGSRFFSPLGSNPGTSLEQHSFAAHTCCHVSPTLPNIYRTCHQPTLGEMPPLAYEPVVRSFTRTGNRFGTRFCIKAIVKLLSSAFFIGVMKDIQSQGDILISCVDNGTDKSFKMKLHDRFTM